MAARTIEEQVESLTGRRVAESRIFGAPSPDAEAVAIFESITLNLLLRPKSAFYVMHLARNGLLKVVQDELDSIDELKTAVEDLGNPSYDVRSTKSLEKARTALLSLEGLDKVSSDSGSFQRFDKAVDEFLEKHLSKSVRRPGEPSLLRPSEEASIDIGTSFSTLKDLHADLVDRLYALAVVIENFESSPLSTLMGLSTASRARADIEDMIDSLEADSSAVLARDMAVRLISDRAALKVIGTLPDLSEPVVSTAQALPRGYELKASADPAPASKDSLVGPFSMPSGASLTVQLPGGSPVTYTIPQSTFDLYNKAYLVSNEVVFPVSVPAYTYLFLSVEFSDGTTQSYRVNLNDTGSTVSVSKASFISLINTALGADGGAMEFISSGSNRILIYVNAGSSPTRDSLTIAPSHSEPSTSTIGILATYYQTSPQDFGFYIGQTGTRASTPAVDLVDAINRLFDGMVTAVENPDGSFSVESDSTDVGTFVTLTSPSVLGLTGTHYAQVSKLHFFGSVLGVDTDPVSAVDLIDIGDEFISDVGSSNIASFEGDYFNLEDSIQSFSGSVTVKSILAERLQALDDLVDSFLSVWGASRFSDDLDKLDAAIAILGTNATPAQRNAVTTLLDDLRSLVVQLQTVLEDPSTSIPKTAGSREREVVNGIISTLTERKYDRALSLFLTGKIQDMLGLSLEEASFGGNLMKTMSDVAQNDVEFVNTAADEEGQPSKAQERSGVV